MPVFSTRLAPRLALRLALAALLVLPLNACSTPEEGEQIGKVVGATAGVLIASRAGRDSDPATHTAMVALGAYFGSLLGGKIGRELTLLDQQYAERAMEEGLDNSKDGDAVVWSNPDSGNSGAITPVSTDPAQNCRDFETSVVIDGEEQQTTGRACKQEDGTWKIVSGSGTPISTP